MLNAFLRAVDIVLAFILVGLVLVAALQQIQRTFRPSSPFILLFLVAFAILGGGYSVYDYTTNLEPTTLMVPTSGVILGGTADFGVYWDVTATRKVWVVQWGILEPGQTGNATFYVRNEATAAIYCAATWAEDSWQPEGASQYFELTWDFGEEPLKPNRARKVVLELHVSPDIHDIEDFSFNIVLTAQTDPFLG